LTAQTHYTLQVGILGQLEITATMARAAAPHPVDRHVGQRIRQRRRALGLSQGTLAARLGISFQQVQKYERGTNRVSASMLLATARALHAPVAAFFDGLETTGDGDDGGLRDLVGEMLATPGGGELAQAWLAIGRPALRARVVGLVRAIAAP